MPEVFFIGDTHFGHKNIINFEAVKPYRPFATIEEHDECLVSRWNSVVSKKDVVWHLGDFAFGSANIDIAGRLNGIKNLVLGNHDHFPNERYLKHFNKLYGVATLKNGLILTHVPVHPGQFSRFSFNIHGHLHTKLLPDYRYINVSCEQIGLKPISLDEIKKIMADPGRAAIQELLHGKVE